MNGSFPKQPPREVARPAAHGGGLLRMRRSAGMRAAEVCRDRGSHPAAWGIGLLARREPIAVSPEREFPAKLHSARVQDCEDEWEELRGSYNLSHSNSWKIPAASFACSHCGSISNSET